MATSYLIYLAAMAGLACLPDISLVCLTSRGSIVLTQNFPLHPECFGSRRKEAALGLEISGLKPLRGKFNVFNEQQITTVESKLLAIRR